MKPQLRTSLPLAALAVAALTAGSAHAVIVITTASTLPVPAGTATTTDEIAYAGDVSTSDLLHGLAGTGGVWLGNGSSPDGLNDGVHGGDFNTSGLGALNGAAWASDGNSVSFREFSLGPGSNGFGYNITGIQSIAAWSGAGFPNQNYTVSFSYIGSPAFISLGTIAFQPFSDVSTAGGSTKVNVTDSTGILATGVDAIRFDILDTFSNNAGGVVMREIDVFGTATIPEPSAALLFGLGSLALLRRRRA